MIRCALLTNFRNDWAAALTLAARARFVTLSPWRSGSTLRPIHSRSARTIEPM